MTAADLPPPDDQPADDAPLREALRSAYLPAAPATLGRNVKRRIQRRIVGQRALLSASAAVVLLGIGWLIQQPGERVSPPVTAAQIDDELLASLFAPPPVDSLSVLDRRQQFALQALSQLEKPRP